MLKAERRNAAPSRCDAAAHPKSFQTSPCAAIARFHADIASIHRGILPCNFFATLSSETRFFAIPRDVSSRRNTRRASCCAP
jgi:hypothetical protein